MKPFAPILLLAGLLAAPAHLAGQPGQRSLPDTPAGSRATGLLEAAGADDDTRRAFVDDAFDPGLRDARPVGEHVERLARLGTLLDGAERVGVRMGGPTSIRLAYRTAGGETVRIRVRVTDAPPHRVAGLQVDVGEAPGASLEIESLEGLDRTLREMEEEGAFSGVVRVADAGDVVYEGAFGVADRETGRAVTTGTRFNVGSLMKPLTGTLILRLAQEGRIDLDAPVGRYVDGLRPRVARSVTVDHLLRHRSGLGDYLRLPGYRDDPDAFRTVDELMTLIRRQELEFEPGSRERYSNSGFVLLGAVVEAVTGRSYAEVLDDWILHPARMARTTLEGRAADPNTAVPYRRTEGGAFESVGDLHGDRGSPAGGGFSTAGDLHRFARALLADRLLEPGWTDVLLAGYDRDVAARRGRVGVGWGGGGPGVNASLEIEPDGTVVAVVANLDPPAASRVAISTMEWLRR